MRRRCHLLISIQNCFGLQAVDQFLTETRSVLDEMIEKGRNLANSGRMELDIHEAIEKLDDIVEVADQLDMEVESQKTGLEPLLAQSEALERDLEAAETVVDTLMARKLSDPAIASATRKDLADRDAQFAALSQRAAAIHAALPGKSSASRDTTLSTLGDKLSQLESTLIASHVTPSRSIATATPIRTSPDRTSMSSMGPLAMEVGNITDAYTTEEEGMKEENSEAGGGGKAEKKVRRARSSREESMEKPEKLQEKGILPKDTSPINQDEEEPMVTFTVGASSSTKDSNSPPQAK
ncbi:hypothetical protein NECAME_14330, partial [Necator americanus]